MRVGVGVIHQTARPQLARILDLEERRMGIDGDANAAAQAIASRLAGFLKQRGGGDPADLTRRIVRAATGYLASA